MTVEHRSDRTDQVLRFIERFVAEHGYGPTIREIMDGTDISSTSVASYNLHKLRREKRIQFADGAARSIRLTSRTVIRRTDRLQSLIARMEPYVTGVPSVRGWIDELKAIAQEV